MSQFLGNYLVKPPMGRASAVHSIFRKSGIQGGGVTGGRIMGYLLPIRLRSQLAGAPAGWGRGASTLDYRIIRCRPADDEFGLRRRQNPQQVPRGGSRIGRAEGYMQTLCISRSTLVPASTERQTRLALSAVVLPAFDTPETFRFLDILVSQRTSV